MRRALALLLAVPAAASADQVLLKGGGRLDGIVVARSASAVVIEIGAGRVTVPLSQVSRVIEGESALSTYQARAARLAADDLAGWLDLARWSSAQGLSTQARTAYEHVRRLDPGSSEANRALGLTLLDGRWVDENEAMLARGFVPFEGEWITPAERESILAERAALRREREDAALAQERLLEAQARAREAEARARQAEAEARVAESQSYLVPSQVPIPFYAGSPFYGGSTFRSTTIFTGRGPVRDPHCDRTEGVWLSVSTETPRPRRDVRDRDRDRGRDGDRRDDDERRRRNRR